MSVTLRLADDIDVSPRRHDLPAEQPARGQPGRRRDGRLVQRPAARSPAQKYSIKHTTRVDASPGHASCTTGSTSTRCTATRPRDTLSSTRSAGCRAASRRPAVRRRVPPQPDDRLLHPHRRGHQRHRRCRHDPRRLSSEPLHRVGHDGPAAQPERRVPQLERHRDMRRAATGHEGTTVWLTGLSGSGKSTVAVALEQRLVARRSPRTCSTATTCATASTPTSASRPTTGPRTSAVSARWRCCSPTRASSRSCRSSPPIAPTATASATAPRGARAAASSRCSSTPRSRSASSAIPKGLYAKARAGEITGFTGIDDPYEAPRDPDVTLTPGSTPDQAAAIVAELLGL